MAVGLNGTFGAISTSAPVSGNGFLISMDFGSGSVDVEKQMPSGAWIKIETGIAADYEKVYDVGGADCTIRLNCTAWVSTIEYSIRPTVY